MIVPYLRGFGSTRFLSDETCRNGEQGALALDALEGTVITVPTITIGSDFDSANADGHAYGQQFSGPIRMRPRRHRAQHPPGAPEAFADAIADVGRASLAE